jgi:hypothetical protein
MVASCWFFLWDVYYDSRIHEHQVYEHWYDDNLSLSPHRIKSIMYYLSVKKGASIYFWSETRDRNVTKKINKELYEIFNESNNVNPLNAELNPICHLLVLLGDLTFMGPCILSIFQYISNKMQRYTVYLYLETALRVSGGTSTHH